MSDLRIKVTPSFEKKALKLLSEVSFDALLDFLEGAPESGNIIKGSGGIRKLRWQSGKDN